MTSKKADMTLPSFVIDGDVDDLIFAGEESSTSEK
jgi:hypothetical protein